MADNEVSEKDLHGFADSLKAFWAARDAEIRQLRNQTFLTELPELPTVEKMPVARAPLAYESLRTQIGHLTANRPRVVVHPLSEGDEDQAAANSIEKWANALLARLAEAEPYLDIGLWNALGDGIGVLKGSWLPWSGFPTQAPDETEESYNKRVALFVARAPTPFALQTIDPLAYFPLYGPLGLEAVVESGVRSRLWASQEFNIGFGTQGRVVQNVTHPQFTRASGELVPYEEIWTTKHVYYLVNRKLVRTIEHGYPVIPYFEIGGEVTGSRDPEKRRKAFIWPYLALQPLYDALLNIVGHHALRSAHTSYYEERDMTAAGQALDAGQQVTEIPLDGIVPGRPGAKLVPLMPGPMSPVIIQALSLLASLMDRTGGNPILSGFAPGARTVGVAASIFMEAAKARLQATGASAGLALKQTLKFFLWLVQNRVGKPVALLSLPDAQRRRGSIRLLPSMADRFADLDVHIDLTLPQDDFARHMDTINLRNNGLWSLWRSMENVGVENPADEMRRILIEGLMQDPQVRQAIIAAALQERGIGAALAEGAAAEEILGRVLQGQQPGGTPAPEAGGGLGVGEPFNIPITSITPREPGLTAPLTPASPGRPAMRAPRPRGRPRR